MAKAVLISIRPEWAEKILFGKKTLEVRKTRPCLEMPFKCYIYYTKGTMIGLRGKPGYVVGEFVCDQIDPIVPATEPYGIYDVDDDFVAQIGLANGALWDYGNGATLYAWHISNLRTYDKPKPLGEFTELRATKFGVAPVDLTRPPQSWCYVEEKEDSDG